MLNSVNLVGPCVFDIPYPQTVHTQLVDDLYKNIIYCKFPVLYSFKFRELQFDDIPAHFKGNGTLIRGMVKKKKHGLKLCRVLNHTNMKSTHQTP